jgi:hypothetical protein
VKTMAARRGGRCVDCGATVRAGDVVGYDGALHCLSARCEAARTARDGGPVETTGGGKYGAPARWVRPDNAREGATVWAATVGVGGVGGASRGRRDPAFFEMLAGIGDDGRAAWRVTTAYRVPRQGHEADVRTPSARPSTRRGGGPSSCRRARARPRATRR